ncbi:MAG: ankyrin repeat domain-containing protein [Spirochaetales bacterium]|nr:ankyrin repeat domain-containing protein [Spirochaetales bacterium]
MNIRLNLIPAKARLLFFYITPIIILAAVWLLEGIIRGEYNGPDYIFISFLLLFLKFIGILSIAWMLRRFWINQPDRIWSIGKVIVIFAAGILLNFLSLFITVQQYILVSFSLIAFAFIYYNENFRVFFLSIPLVFCFIFLSLQVVDFFIWLSINAAVLLCIHSVRARVMKLIPVIAAVYFLVINILTLNVIEQDNRIEPDDMTGFRLLFQLGADVNARITDPVLCLIASSNSTEAADFLIDKGALINVYNENGFTPFHVATAMGSLSMVELLLARGADREMKAIKGFTPFILAIRRGRLEIVQYLLSVGVDTETGFPLHTAVREGKVEITEFLLKEEFNPNQKDGSGNTPLFYAIIRNKVADVSAEMTKLLLAFGADRELRNMDGKTALEVVRERGDSELVQMLEEDDTGGMGSLAGNK